ncbi:alpha/beta hydrolase [Parapedobacter sp. 10938]|uniref:alpha/beta hydrolase n=1 Tax=Parapedobacter flavus TaxID=3110225 RepID=UPI002DB930B6|nr:alpha/beta hydrolase [Parapedobacter sp. 10938]MEC3880730.1 alpha/beta hydrolase [Parapedobacter sp. 10938]
MIQVNTICKALTIGIGLSIFSLVVNAQQQLPLYPAGIPNAKEAENLERHEPNTVVDSLAFDVSEPCLGLYLVPEDRATGTAVIICPGGGYHTLLTKREGSDVARTFNKLGVSAIVLHYRLPNDRIMVDRSIGPLQDLQQAIKTVRERAHEWHIDPSKIGVMGFSAGGHLAATAGTHHADAYIDNPENTSLRPDFMLLVNPVISFMDEVGHTGSRANLLGDQPSDKQLFYFSNELHVDSLTPPAFLVHSGADEVVSVENSLYFYRGLRQHHIAAAMHIYAKGEHGFLTAPTFDEWFGRCVYWMDQLGLK